MLVVWQEGKLSLKLQFTTPVLLETIFFLKKKKKWGERTIGIFLGSAEILVHQCVPRLDL